MLMENYETCLSTSWALLLDLKHLGLSQLAKLYVYKTFLGMVFSTMFFPSFDQNGQSHCRGILYTPTIFLVHYVSVMSPSRKSGKK